MATYAVQSPPHAGAQITTQTPASGDLAPTGNGVGLLVQTAGTATTVTLPITPTYDGLAVASRTFTCPATGLTLIPLPSAVYGAGPQVVNYSAVTAVSVAVITVPS